MKQISYWAGRNIIVARLLLCCIKVILLVLACFTGMELNHMAVVLPSGIIYAGALVILFTIVGVYPASNASAVKKSGRYVRQKLCDFILPLSAFLVIATAVNSSAPYPSRLYASGIIKKSTAQEILASGKTRDMLTRAEKRILKKEFFKQLRIFAAAKITGDEETSGKAWKFTLAIIAAVGLSYLLAALACSLSCSGAEAAAVLVLALGITGLVFGLIAVIKRINRGPKEKPKPATDNLTVY